VLKTSKKSSMSCEHANAAICCDDTIVQAVVLVGGQGTRLRPLTLTTPKPLVPLTNRPLIEHIVRWLEESGVEQVILATQYGAAAFERWLASWKGIEVRAIEEPVPLGTAGAVANVAHLLRGTTAIINGDNVTNIDLARMLDIHRRNDASATIAVASVDDPTGRGVAVMEHDGRLTRFQEKPASHQALARTVNTGTYMIEPNVLRLVGAGQAAMWETDIFPALIASGQRVFGCDLPHIWLDAGTLSGYLTTQAAILAGRVASPDGTWIADTFDSDAYNTWIPPIVIGRDTTVDTTVRLDGPVSIGHGCQVRSGAHIVRSAIWDGCTIEDGATIHDSVIGYNSHVARGAFIAGALIGDGVTIHTGVRVASGSRIAPGSTITSASY
jgi:NDP-sugar pyrophosphorylase family protein